VVSAVSHASGKVADVADFDPYHKWLGIPRAEQPPNHYRLLGTQLFESDRDVIKAAADQRMAHLRTFQTGKHMELSQELLNEVAAAKLCLLKPEKKATYDARLRRQLAAKKQKRGPHKKLPKAVPLAATPHDPEPLARADQKTSVGRARRHRSKGGPMIAAAAVGFLLVAGVIVWALSSDGLLLKQIVQSLGATASPPPSAKPGGADGGTEESPGRAPAEQPPVAPKEPPTETPAVPQEPPADEPEPATGEPEESPEAEPTPGEPEEWPEPEPQKLARPSGDAQKEVLAQLEQVFDLKGAKTRADKVKLAKELLKLGKESKDNPAERFVLLRKTMELACEGGDAALMVEAIDAIGQDFETDVLEAKRKMLVQFARQAEDSVRIRSLVEAAMPVSEAALAERRYETAMALVDASYAACTRPGGRIYRKKLYERREEMKKLVAEEKRIQRTLAALEAEPDNAEAHLAVGRWYCYFKDDWQRGLPHLAKGSDAALAAVARRELGAPPAEAADQIALGDAWWNLANNRRDGEKDALMLRAGTWYQQAANQVTDGLTRMKLDKRLADIAKIEPPATKVGAASPPPGSNGDIRRGRWVDVLRPVDVKKNRVAGTWTRIGDMVKTVAGPDRSRLLLPVRLEGSYELAVEFTPHSSNQCVVIVLPVGLGQCLLVLGWDGIGGLDLIDGARATKNPTTRKLGALQPGRRYTVLARVQLTGENATVGVSLNGIRIIHWTGRQASLSVTNDWGMAERSQPALGADKIAVTFYRVRLRLLSGKVDWVRR